MQILVIGKPSLTLNWRQFGFSLIELLIVMFIMGFLLSNINLNFNNTFDSAKQLAEFKQQFHYALDYTTFSRQILGLSIDEQGYAFLSYHPPTKPASPTNNEDNTQAKEPTSTWQIISDITQLEPQNWHNAEEIAFMDLVVDEQSVVITTKKERHQKPQIIILPNYEYNSFLLTITNNEKTHTLDLTQSIF